MDQLENLKAILHSKRANVYYLEMCRVMQKNGRVLYLTETDDINQYWNIPIANTTSILLGTGTSITNAAMRMLASAGVLVGFCGGGATPLFHGTEIEWMTPQNEYRPTEYVQAWLKFWYDENKRLIVAKNFQIARLDYMYSIWGKDRELKFNGFDVNKNNVVEMLEDTRNKIKKSTNINQLLQIEGEITKKLYKLAAANTKIKDFKRNRSTFDKANTFLNHGNYLAYGMAATTLWVLGIPHGFAVLHGKTRRGALVFDIADLIKDTLVLPWAFICASEDASENEFRQQCIQAFADHGALDYMFKCVKSATKVVY